MNIWDLQDIPRAQTEEKVCLLNLLTYSQLVIPVIATSHCVLLLYLFYFSISLDVNFSPAILLQGYTWYRIVSYFASQITPVQQNRLYTWLNPTSKQRIRFHLFIKCMTEVSPPYNGWMVQLFHHTIDVWVCLIWLDSLFARFWHLRNLEPKYTHTPTHAVTFSVNCVNP